MGGFLSDTSTWFQDVPEEPGSGPKIQATNTRDRKWPLGSE